MDQIRISAKVLGQMAMPDFCPRCFWVKLHVKKVPWQIFPGIFSTIDAYTKKIVHEWIDRGKDRPVFLDELGVTGYTKVPHWSKFKTETKYGITLSGGADDMLTVPNGIHIPDYKTAKFTANQDKLFPMYQAQVNGYGKIGIATGIKVDSLSLIYMEPATDDAQVEANGKFSNLFKMAFIPHYLPIEMDVDSINPLLERARDIYDGPIPDKADCKDCAALDAVMEAIQ